MKIYIWTEIIANWDNLSLKFRLKDFAALAPDKDIMSVKYQLRQLQKYGLVSKGKKLTKHYLKKILCSKAFYI